MSTEGRHKKFDDWTCVGLYKASLKCLDDNQYDKTKCIQHFEAYKDCKKEEIETRKKKREEERKASGRGSGFFN